MMHYTHLFITCVPSACGLLMTRVLVVRATRALAYIVEVRHITNGTAY